MVKFEVGKVYETSNLLEPRVLQEVIARSKHFLITKTIKGCGVSEWENELSHVISVVNGVEVCMNPFRQQELSADREANIQEEKKEEVESDDWSVGKEYEAVCLETQQRFKVKLIHYDEDSCYLLTFNSTNTKSEFPEIFENYKDIAFAEICGEECDKTVVIFKHGIKSILDWEEVKEEPRKLIPFEVGKEYKAFNGEMWECKAIFYINESKIVIFYNKNTDVIIRPTIKTLNSVEYTNYDCLEVKVDFIADEQYRDEIQALL